jgi:hypothetical protein
MASSFSIKVLVSFATILVLVKSLNLPIPNRFDEIMYNPYFVCALLFSSAWGATQDVSASCTGVFLYVCSIMLFYDKRYDKAFFNKNKLMLNHLKSVEISVSDPVNEFTTSELLTKPDVKKTDDELEPM